MQPAPLVSLLLVLSAGCVPSVPHFVTSAEARAGRPYEDAAYGAARIEPGLQPSAPASVSVATGKLVSAAYWHWDGLKYVWIEGETEVEAPAYLWQWQRQSR
jgi:hypothetical protein